MSRRHDPRRAKSHRTYTVKELAALFDIDPRTVHDWRQDGLLPIDNRKPFLFSGADIQAHLVRRREREKRPCGPGQIYCVACKKVQSPKGGTVRFQPVSSTSGNFIGTCPGCGRPVYRRVSLQNLTAAAGKLKVTFEDVSAT
jgi:hypothetical protein